VLLIGTGLAAYFLGYLGPPGVGGRRGAAPADTVPSAKAALGAAIRPESIPPINRGVQSSRPKPRPIRPASRRPPAGFAGAEDDSTRQPAALVDTVAPPQPPAAADSATPRSASPSPTAREGETEREVAGYVPMAPAGSGQPAAERPTRPARAADESPEAADDPPPDARKLESAIRDGVDECYRTVRAKQLDQLARLYDPRTVADEEKLRRLTRILRTEPWQAVVGRRVDGARELGSRTAAAEFSFRLAWRDAYGGRLSSQPIFRAEFARDGEDWTMSSCRIVGSPKL
jgi:hypothetical protein